MRREREKGEGEEKGRGTGDREQAENGDGKGRRGLQVDFPFLSTFSPSIQINPLPPTSHR